jgi:hypothetical protein
MSSSFSALRVHLARADEIAGRDDLPAVVAAVTPLVQRAATAFRAAEDVVRDAVQTLGKEAPEAVQAVAKLGEVYDGVRLAAQANVAAFVDDGPSSSHTTPTETLEAADELVGLLQDQGDAKWAAVLLAELGAALDVATKEVDEKTRAGDDLQKAQATRATAAAEAWTRFRQFRRVVGHAFGRTSREYHSLRTARRGGGGGEGGESGGSGAK